MYEVSVKRTFSAAHRLEDIGGKCEDLHGHNFSVEVSVAGDKLNSQGVVLDFRILKEWIDRILADLDHRYLNEAAPFKGVNPSSENIARVVYEMIREKARALDLSVSSVTVWESDSSRATYKGKPE